MLMRQGAISKAAARRLLSAAAPLGASGVCVALSGSTHIQLPSYPPPSRYPQLPHTPAPFPPKGPLRHEAAVSSPAEGLDVSAKSGRVCDRHPPTLIQPR